MTSTERKLVELIEWGGKEKRPPLPSHLLPSYDDVQSLVYRETPAMRYFMRLLSDMVEEMNGMAEEIEYLRKTVATLQKQGKEKAS
jgi:hypothetical protein